MGNRTEPVATRSNCSGEESGWAQINATSWNMGRCKLGERNQVAGMRFTSRSGRIRNLLVEREK